MKTIRGKKALVTGAASGLGRAIALALAREGADLFLIDVNVAGLGPVVREAEDCGVAAVAHGCDLTDPAAITAAVQALLARWGHVDIVVNNAGIAYYGPTHKMTAGQWDRILGVNLYAPVRIVHELLPTLLERPEAHVLNMGSISGLVAGGRFAAYHVSKFGIVGFSEALRAEYGRRGIGVTALCPGPVRTNLYKSAASGRKDGTVPEPPRWICTTEAKVARAAVRAIRRNKRMVLLTPLAHLLFNLKKFTPWLLDAVNHLGRKKPHAAELAASDNASTRRAA
jgi:NAD(P)-dependent dehydrogenase (short-subunit alcohol dehydrogenase family)